MRRTYAILLGICAVAGLIVAGAFDSPSHKGPTPHVRISGAAQGFTVTFPDGSSLPVAVSTQTGKTPPTNQLKPHDIVLGTNPATQVHVTLTPGHVIPPLLPTGPSGTTDTTGPTGVTGTTSSTTSTSTTATTTTTSSNGPPGQVTLQASFDNGTLAQFNSAQCANTGTVSQPPRYRGTLNYESSIVGQGSGAIRIDLPTTPSGYLLTACNLNTPHLPIGLGSTEYQGLMVYVPSGWTIPNNAATGVEIYELHFQNVYGAPLSLQLHPDSIVLQLETGACFGAATSVNPSNQQGCTYRSNITCQKGWWTCLPTKYVIPPGRLVQGAWNEVIVGTDWEGPGAGTVQTWYRVKGSTTWNSGDSVTGVPTVQWDQAASCCAASYHDELTAYTFAIRAPMSVWFDQAVDGTSFNAVAVQLP